MFKHKIIGIMVFFLLVGAPALLYAAPLTRSFSMSIGGRITTGPTQLSTVIACAASYGPFLMRPVNVALPGPYFIRATTSGLPSRGGQLLGKYQIIPDMSTCYNPETGAPVPAFEIKPYGISR